MFYTLRPGTLFTFFSFIFETKVGGSEREVGKEPDCKLGERCLFSLYLFSLVNKSNFVGLDWEEKVLLQDKAYRQV